MSFFSSRGFFISSAVVLGALLAPVGLAAATDAPGEDAWTLDDILLAESADSF